MTWWNIRNRKFKRIWKQLGTKLNSRNLITGISKYLGCPPHKILGTILEVNQRKKKIRSIRTYIPETNSTDYICQEKKEGEELPALKIALMHRYYKEKCIENVITTTKNHTDNTKINRTKINRKLKWEENNSMDILSDKLVTSHTRKLGSG